MTQIVQFEKKEALDLGTVVFQVEDGTIFYCEKTFGLLYVKMKGEHLFAEIPGGVISTVAAFENAVYFEASRKIYKAVVDGDKITVTHERDLLEDVEVNGLGLCTMVLPTGDLYIYRMCDDFGDGVLVDIDVAGYIKERIHKGKLYFVKRHEFFQTEMRSLGENIVGVEIPSNVGACHSYAHNSSNYIYISNRNKLYTLDTVTFERLPVLDFGSVCFLTIVGVIDGVITATCFDAETYLITAKIPDGFYDQRTPLALYSRSAAPEKKCEEIYATDMSDFFSEPAVTRPVATTPYKMRDNTPKDTLDTRIDELSQQLDKQSVNDSEAAANEKYLDQQLQKFDKEFRGSDNESAEEKKRREYEREMNTTINELIDKNMELTQQIEELKKKNHEQDESVVISLAELCDRNSELSKKHKELETLNWELTNELDRTEDLNEELEATNEQLTKEKDELMKKREIEKKEKTTTIEKLEAEIAKVEKEIEERNRMQMSNLKIDSSAEEVLQENENIKRRIEIIMNQNEKLSKVLAETSEPSSEEEYEIVDDVADNDHKSTQSN